MLVMKFGGTSVGDADCFRRVKDIVAGAVKSHAPVAVVVSAMSTVTDTLLEAARRAAAGDSKGLDEKLAYLEQKHFTAADALFAGKRRTSARQAVTEICGEFRRICNGMALLRDRPPRAMDAGLSAGERLSAALLSRFLDQEGLSAEAVDASECIVTDDNFLSARPLMDLTREAARKRLLPLTGKGVVPVITGFIGATRDGVRTTIGRGASDYSGAIFSSCLDADELWIWTDVDGVLSADPKMVRGARILEELTYEEAAELSHFGAKVLHHRTMAPLVEQKIPVWIKNTFAPEKAGTRIGPSHAGTERGPKAVSSLAPVSLLTLRSSGNPGATELFARTFAALSRSEVEILMVTQSSYQDSFCLLVPQASAERAGAALERAFRLEMNHHYMEHPERQDVSAIALIGEGMRGTPGIAARLFGALGSRKINIIAIAQGSSESNISLVVSLDDRGAAVSAIHEEFLSPAPR
jgi:aspartate kinase